MKLAKENLETIMEAPGVKMQKTTWGGMAALYCQFAAGTDFTPLLKGLKDDLCQCPHWGYVLSGAVHMRYADGTEEVAEAGELWYMPPGHTGWVDVDTEYVEFSPDEGFQEVFDHVQRMAAGG